MVILLSLPAFGQESILTELQRMEEIAAVEEKIQRLENLQTENLTTFSTFIATVLLLLLLVGVTIRDMGLVQSKNMISIAMKHVAGLAAVIFSYFLIGYTIMFQMAAGGPDFQFPVSFTGCTQALLAATCCAIAVGSMAGRTRFSAHVIFAVVLGAVLYPAFGQWVSGSQMGGESGWLEPYGFHDFAGATSIHVVGGSAALAGIIIAGARRGRFGKNGQPFYLPGNNLSMTVIGSLLIWAGWFGLVLTGRDFTFSESSGLIANTTLSAVSSGIVGVLLFRMIRGTTEPQVVAHSLIGGLVAISAACDVVDPISAVAIGAVAGLITTTGSVFLEKMKLDDVSGGVSIHLINGIWATLPVALFPIDQFSVEILKTQALGTFSVAAGVFLTSLALFKVIDLWFGLRMYSEAEEAGQDFSEHSATTAIPNQ